MLDIYEIEIEEYLDVVDYVDFVSVFFGLMVFFYVDSIREMVVIDRIIVFGREMNIVGFDDSFGWIFFFFENEEDWDDCLYGESFSGIRMYGGFRNDDDFVF